MPNCKNEIHLHTPKHKLYTSYLLFVEWRVFGVLIQGLVHLAVIPTQTAVQDFVGVVKRVHEGHGIWSNLC